MNAHVKDRQFLLLVDDDAHSARLLLRTLAERGAPRIEWIGGAAESRRLIAQLRHEGPGQWPDLLIVDLKSRSSATAEFIAEIGNEVQAMGAAIVAMAPSLASEVREPLIAAGAAAVFERHPQIEAYRREVAELLAYWARTHGTDSDVIIARTERR